MDHSDILAGMDAADEYGGLPEIEYELAATRAQRDTLLAALKDIVSRPCCSVIGCGPDCPVERAFSAIKMVGASDGHK